MVWKSLSKTCYEVSDTGEVRRIGTTTPKRQRINKATGYKRVNIRIEGIRFTFDVHRLVAKLFVENPDNKPLVNHKDGNKLNNNKGNLEWVTKSENSKHAYLMGLTPKPPLSGYKGSQCKNAKITERDVIDIRNSPMGCRLLGRKYGLDPSTVRSIILRETWKHV